MRYLSDQIVHDLDRKMVFLGGPRQVGKTTLAKSLLTQKAGYLNWDIAKDRSRILAQEMPNTKMWVLDELHKYRKWRNYLKGLYDAYHPNVKILVTGSARLDFYRFGGDSLQGRYHYLRLMPLSVAELKIETHKDLQQLYQLGGFPEPFYSASQTFARRWSREYRQRLLQEDVRSLESTQDLGSLEILMMRLPDLVGSPLSINGLREDLQVSHKTTAKWLAILERLYHIFRLPPFGSPAVKAVKKEQKHFHFDWSLVQDPGNRFENFVAVHLLKNCFFVEDTQGFQMELRYFRDRDGREVDFVVIKDGKPEMFVEAKLSDESVSPDLIYLAKKFPHVRCVQTVLKMKGDSKLKNGVEVMGALELLKSLT